MAETTNSPAKTPWHLWTVGAVSLLWNAMGALDFTMTQTRNAAWMSQLTPAQQEYVYAFPLWAVAAWGLATWGSVLGSVLLLARSRLAVRVNVGVIPCMLLTSLYTFVLSDGLKAMGGGVGHVIFNALIALICFLLAAYALVMQKRGVLR